MGTVLWSASGAAIDAPATRRSIRRRRIGLVAVAVVAVLAGWAALWSWTARRPDVIPWQLPAAAALVFAAMTVDLGVRQHRTTSVLRANPWVEVTSKVHQIPLHAGAAHALTMLELQGAPDDGTVLATSAGVRARPMVDLVGRTWVAGDDRRFYIAPPGGAPIVRAKRVRLTARAADPDTVVTPLHSRLLPDI